MATTFPLIFFDRLAISLCTESYTRHSRNYQLLPYSQTIIHAKLNCLSVDEGDNIVCLNLFDPS